MPLMSNVMRQHMPLLVEALQPSSMQVARLGNGSFHVYVAGAAPLLLCFSDGLLVRGPLEELLRIHCAGSATFIPAIFSNAEQGAAQSAYVECVPHEEVKPESIASLSGPGFKVWHHARGSMFLSEALVREVQQYEWSKSLSFTPGFSRFAAGA